MNILNIQDKLLQQQVGTNGTGGNTGTTGIDPTATYIKTGTGGSTEEKRLGSLLTQAEIDSGLWLKYDPNISTQSTFQANNSSGDFEADKSEASASYQAKAGKFGKAGFFDKLFNKGENKGGKKGGPTFSDLRALNALQANKLRRPTQIMPVGEMASISATKESEQINKQKEDAQANANAARIFGSKGSDPTRNLAQNMGLTEQANKATEQANLQQGQYMQQQENMQQQQSTYANKVAVNNQNVRIGLTNAAERELAAKQAGQGIAKAQITNTWLGDKEGEKARKDMSNAALVDKYSQYSFSTDPATVALANARTQAVNNDYNKKLELDAKDKEVRLLEYQINNATDTTSASYGKKLQELEMSKQELVVLKDQYKETQAALLKAKQDYKEAEKTRNLKVANLEDNMADRAGVVGDTSVSDAKKSLLAGMNAQTPIKKSGGNLALKQQYKLELQNVRAQDKAKLKRDEYFMKSLVLPEPKAYYLAVKNMAARNKQINDMFKDAYKAIYGNKK